jgi:antitoxin ParD1/3/4
MACPQNDAGSRRPEHKGIQAAVAPVSQTRLIDGISRRAGWSGFAEGAPQTSNLIIVIKKSRIEPSDGRIAMISADLGQQLESYIAQLVESGRYGSKSEVLREGVRLIQDRETQLAALDASIFRSVEDADNGRTKPAGDVFDRLEAKYQSLAKRSK